MNSGAAILAAALAAEGARGVVAQDRGEWRAITIGRPLVNRPLVAAAGGIRYADHATQGEGSTETYRALRRARGHWIEQGYFSLRLRPRGRPDRARRLAVTWVRVGGRARPARPGAARQRGETAGVEVRGWAGGRAGGRGTAAAARAAPYGPADLRSISRGGKAGPPRPSRREPAESVVHPAGGTRRPRAWVRRHDARGRTRAAGHTGRGASGRSAYVEPAERGTASRSGWSTGRSPGRGTAGTWCTSAGGSANLPRRGFWTASGFRPVAYRLSRHLDAHRLGAAGD
jgi:hypothetical protein